MSLSASGLEAVLLREIQEWVTPGDLDRDTPLIQSGRFESLGLLNLVVWVEAQIGRGIDPAAIDLTKEWNTVADIAQFVIRNRDGMTAS